MYAIWTKQWMLVLPLLTREENRFLDASTHLYKRLCPSVRPSVGPSVGPSVRPSVGHAFLKYRGNRVLRTTKQVNSSKFKKIQVNSRKFRKILSFSHLLDASLFASNLFEKKTYYILRLIFFEKKTYCIIN